MKLFIKMVLLLLAGAFMVSDTSGQANASLNILTLNSGLVNQGGSVYVQVTVANTGPVSTIGQGKVRAVISIPSTLVSNFSTAQQDQLFPGWTVVTNTASAITICNSTSSIPVNTSQTSLIKLNGNTLGGPSTVLGQLNFPTGICSGPNGSLTGDNNADNSSTSTVQVVAANQCTIVPQSVVLTPGAIACNGGTTTLTANAGQPANIEYSLNGGAFQTSQNFTVSVGTYTVTARRISDPSCFASNSIIITQPTAITASASAPAISGFCTTTLLTVVASGGTGTLQYSIDGGTTYQAGNTFTVGEGSYTVTVKDNNNCTATSNTVVVSPPAATSVTASAAPIVGFCKTTLTVTASGGAGTLQYSINGGITYQAGNTFTVGAGSYTVTVKDANNCTAISNTVVVTQPAPPTVTASAGTISCNGGTTTLTVTASGGTSPLEYSLNNGLPPFQPGNTFTVGAGDYLVTVRDANLCTLQTTISIVQPTAIQVTAAAPPIAIVGGTTNVTVSATGGNPPYSGTGSFTRSAGTYLFTVTDANGCTSNTSITISDPFANAFINILTLNSGIVNQGGTVDLQVTVGNTGSTGAIGPNKVRAAISVPSSIVSILPNGQQTGLPSGWSILTNNGGTISLCNGSDVIAVGTSRTFVIKIQGNTVGGPSTILGQLTFSRTGVTCGGPSGSLNGDNPADNSSTSTVQVFPIPPVAKLNLKVYLEGWLYQNAGLPMAANYFNLGDPAYDAYLDDTMADSILVNLWSPADLGNATPTYSFLTGLHTDGTDTVSIPGAAIGGSYYIAIVQRSHMETWSHDPILLAASNDYDFTTGQNKAYDDGTNPPMQVAFGLYALYAGDITKEGAIVLQDMNEIINRNGFFSYDISDVNGDGATDGQDMNFVINNQQLGLFYARPY